MTGVSTCGYLGGAESGNLIAGCFGDKTFSTQHDSLEPGSENQMSLARRDVL